ncbi:RING1 and YY1-binding protein A isoform X1 [Clupea harengus]|uniref:RING1 and YY1-binding protein A isoform X1 n=1 Tax=Clupea harengus TaxID=7950 RepID=A0A6P3W5K8_CLUHA|nr:RING1 and YY1-binding protein A isoform X1 [Clupea harengus]
MGDKKSPTRPKRHAKPSADDGFWDCSVCTFKNSAEAFKCSMCDVRKGTSTRKPRINSQLVAQQVAQQFATPPPPKKERRERTDRDRHDLDLHDDEHLDTDHSDSDRLSSIHPDSDTAERPHRMEELADRERRLEHLGLERGREVARGRAEQDRQLPERDRQQPERDRQLPERDRQQPERDRQQPERDRQLPERDRQLPERDRQLPERDRQLPERDRQQPERDRQLPERDRQLPERDRQLPERAWPDRESPIPVGLEKVRPNKAHTLHPERRSSAGSEVPEQEPERACLVRDPLKKDKTEKDKVEKEPAKHSDAVKGAPVLIKKPTAKKTKPRLNKKGIPSEKNSVKSGKSAAKKNNNRLLSRPKLKNIDRSSAQQLAITVGNVTVIITDFKEKTRSSSTSSSTVTSSVGSDLQNHTSGSESTDRNSSRASTPRGELATRHEETH